MYRTLRQQQSGTPAGELALARWCDAHQLPDRANVHWSNLLRFDPQHKEALRHLGLRWYRGQPSSTPR